MDDLIIKIAAAVVAILSAVVTRYVVPLIKGKTTVQDLEAAAKELQMAVEVITYCVTVAYDEGTKKGWNGDAQKAWAISKAKGAFGVDLTEAQYDLIRKSIVREVKSAAVALETT